MDVTSIPIIPAITRSECVPRCPLGTPFCNQLSSHPSVPRSSNNLFLMLILPRILNVLMSLSPIRCCLLKFLSTKRAACSTCTTTSGDNTWKSWSAATGHVVCELRKELLPILFRGDRGHLWEGHFRDAVLSFLFYFYEIIPTLAINTHSLLRYPPSVFKQLLWDTLKWWRGLLDGLKVDWFGLRQ